jgi:NADP-dependent 3-hydroxy acid dehydrogenase YdfG
MSAQGYDDMTHKLVNTVAIVTGASSGIGQAIALLLAGAGAKVALVGRRADRLDALASKIRDTGGTAIGIPADLTSSADAAQVVERTIAQYGRLDTLSTLLG